MNINESKKMIIHVKQRKNFQNQRLGMLKNQVNQKDYTVVWLIKLFMEVLLKNKVNQVILKINIQKENDFYLLFFAFIVFKILQC
jgi:hypothetical protein